MSLIPQDLIDDIVEAVGDDKRSLKNCALVSSSFLLPSRKRLLCEINLTSDHACKRLHQLLVQNPVLQSFVRSITMSGDRFYNPYLNLHHTALIAVLRLPFCCLQNFTLILLQRLQWNDFSSGLQDALSAIIHSSSLETLYLAYISELPISLFQGIRLTKLMLRAIAFSQFGRHSASLTVAASEGKATTVSDTVVDQFEWTCCVRVIEPQPIFLPFMCRLRSLKLCIDGHCAGIGDFRALSFIMRSLRVSLATPPMLEQLAFQIVLEVRDSNSLNSDAFLVDIRDVDFWSDLDSIVTHPTGSRLQKVDINISYNFDNDPVDEPDDTKVFELILDSLPLLRERGILFVGHI